jgi:transposase-like protein
MGKPVDLAKKQEAIEAVKSGAASITEAAKTYGFGYSTIHEWVRGRKTPISERTKYIKVGPKVEYRQAPDNHTMLEMMVDKNSTVVDVKEVEPDPSDDVWVIEFQGKVEVFAKSIDEALKKVRERGIVRRVISARIKEL